MIRRTGSGGGGKRLAAWLAGAAGVSFTLVALLYCVPHIGVLEWRLSDHWARARHGGRLSPSVAVVGVDEETLRRHSWPLEKDFYAELIAYLQEMGTAAIAFDIAFFDDLKDCGKGDSLFHAMVELSPDVVMSFGATLIERGSRTAGGAPGALDPRFAVGPAAPGDVTMLEAVLPYPALMKRVQQLGFLNLPTPFIDGVDRRTPLLLARDSLIYPSLALRAAMVATDTRSITRDPARRTLSVGGRTVPLDRDGMLYVDFTDSMPVYPMSDVRASHRDRLLGRTPAVGRQQLDGRVVFIGNTAVSLGDFGVSPLSAGSSMGRSPNVLMHARAAASLLEGDALRAPGRWVALLLSAAVVALMAVSLFVLTPAPAYVAAALLLGSCLLGAYRSYAGGVMLPVAEALTSGGTFALLGALVLYFDKEVDRRRLYTLFGCYLARPVIDHMYRKGVRPELGGEEVRGTAFFSDLEGFSTIAQDMAPAELVGFLNEYFEDMTRILLQWNGTLDKFVGDAIVGFFGAPVASHTHARDACLAAVRMQESLSALRRHWVAQGRHPEKLRNLHMRIGINTGRFVTGNFGCTLRANYTMIGDTVNLASRLETAAREYSVYTLVGEETYLAVRHDFRFRRLDRIRVKGRDTEENIYQLMGAPRSDDERLLELIGVYEEGLDHYLGGDMERAAACFERSLHLERYPHLANPSVVMVRRCRERETVK